jgi:hypothetical protein
MVAEDHHMVAVADLVAAEVVEDLVEVEAEDKFKFYIQCF